MKSIEELELDIVVIIKSAINEKRWTKWEAFLYPQLQES